MSDLLNKPIVLSLNANWQRIGWMTPKQAFVAMCGGVYGSKPPALGISVTVDENGGLVEAIPLAWDEWVGLPVRDSDLAIQTKSGAIRCPTVVIRPNFAKMPVKLPKLTKEAILARDGYRCQYSGEVLPRSQLNIDHVVPRDRGGKDCWENLVASRKDINSKKGNKLNEEAGLRLLKKPAAPREMPISFTIRDAKRPEHVPFIKH